MVISFEDWKTFDKPLRLNYSVERIPSGEKLLSVDIEIRAISVYEFPDDFSLVSTYSGNFIFARICGSGGFVLPKEAFEEEPPKVKEFEYKSDGFHHKLKPLI